MLLEEYPYKNRPEDVKRDEDEYLYGYELYRAGTHRTYLVPFCIGAYGYKTRFEAKEAAIKRFSDDKNGYMLMTFKGLYSVYVKTYKMDRNRDVIDDSVETICIVKNEIIVTDECLKNGTIEQL